MTAVTISLLLSLLPAPSASGMDEQPPSGAVGGSVSVHFGEHSIELASLGPLIAYLQPVGKDVVAPELPAKNPRIQQKNARFQPDFLVVCQGQTVEMPNDDKIYHNVFSYSKPNAFDLGLYRQGSSRSVRFDHPGVVKIYCSIHESMNGVILVTPTRHHVRVKSDGSFKIEGVPPGKYVLTIWCGRLPERTASITIESGKLTTEAIRFSLGTESSGETSLRRTGDTGVKKSTASLEGVGSSPTATALPALELESDCCTTEAEQP